MAEQGEFVPGGLRWEDVAAAIPLAQSPAGEELLKEALYFGYPNARNDGAQGGARLGVVYGDLRPEIQSVAQELLAEGWLEARHDGGILDSAVHNPTAQIVAGWRVELCLRDRPAASLSGLSVRAPEVTFDQLIMSPKEAGCFSLFGGDRPQEGGAIVIMVGPVGSGKTARAEAMANAASKKILAPSVGSLLDPRRSILANQAVLRAVLRESRSLLLIEHAERFFPRSFPPPAYSEVWSSFLEANQLLCVLTTAAPDLLAPCVAERADWINIIDPPRLSERRAIWEKMAVGLALHERVDFHQLARRFALNPGGIRRSVGIGLRAARERKPGVVAQEDFERGATLQVRHGLDKLARRVATDLVLDDLIVTGGVREEVEAIVDAARVREVVFDDWGFAAKQPRGRGLSMLFDGEPGTGKTLCAEILSAELRLPLYRVSMANILSKWVGETEKNLERIFLEAQGSRAILLFDEADALFSKRVEVQQASDRFANLEINTLLQLMESHDGVCVLTTNLKSGIDKAFERRLSFRVHFPFPDEPIRARLWAHHLPEQAPVDQNVDLQALADAFELSGGSIRNAVVRAAYRAAAREGAISQADLMEGAKSECVAAGKLYRVIQDDE